MVNDKRDDKPGVSRRGVLRGIGLSAAGAAAAGTLVREADAAPLAPAPQAQSSGYRESDHVRRVYELARF
jgi:hypothetical protein